MKLASKNQAKENETMKLASKNQAKENETMKLASKNQTKENETMTAENDIFDLNKHARFYRMYLDIYRNDIEQELDLEARKYDRRDADARLAQLDGLLDRAKTEEDFHDLGVQMAAFKADFRTWIGWDN